MTQVRIERLERDVDQHDDTLGEVRITLARIEANQAAEKEWRTAHEAADRDEATRTHAKLDAIQKAVADRSAVEVKQVETRHEFRMAVVKGVVGIVGTVLTLAGAYYGLAGDGQAKEPAAIEAPPAKD